MSNEQHWAHDAPETLEFVRGKIFYANVGDLERATLDKMAEFEGQRNSFAASIEELQKREAMLVSALRAMIGNTEADNDESEAAHRQARYTLSATSAETEAWLQAEIRKRLGEPVAWKMVHYHGWDSFYSARQVAETNMDVTTNYLDGKQLMPLYRLPSPLATPEERKD